METRTIGSFIATMRKANGMTQKDLAEKLGVSDKAVSRWERDECAPDLTLIPVLADIFGVTTDELLRGQRNNPENPQPEQPTKKSEKQINRILTENKTRFTTNSLIALGIGLIGLLAAMICNLAFLRAYLGFFVGSAFYVAAGIMEAIFGVKAFSSVSGEDFVEEVLDAHRKELKGILKSTVLGLLLLFVITLPLVIHVYDAYWGLSFGSWLGLALIYCAVAAGLFLLGQWLYRGIRLTRSKESPEPKDEKARKQFHLQSRVIGMTALALVITFALQAGFNVFSAEYLPFAAGETFQNIDDFYTWAMTAPEGSYSGQDYFFGEPYAGEEWFDDDGNSVPLEELRQQAGDGATFDRINAIVVISPRKIVRVDSKGNSTYFPLTAYTDDDHHANDAATQAINICFLFLYVGQIAGGIVIYSKKRKTL